MTCATTAWWDGALGAIREVVAGADATRIAAICACGQMHGTVLIDADGGTLEIDWREDGVWMTGPVAHVFDGWLSPEFLAQHA